MLNFSSGLNVSHSVLSQSSSRTKAKEKKLAPENANGATTPSKSLNISHRVKTACLPTASDQKSAVSSAVAPAAGLRVQHNVIANTGLNTAHAVSQDAGLNLKQMLKNVNMGVSDFTWSSIGGIMIGVGILAAGVIVMVSTGGAAAPAVFASVCTSMGTTGILYSMNKAIDGEEVDWTCYATETLVTGAISLCTFSVAKGLAIAKGLKEVAELSRMAMAGASAITQSSATAIRNSAEGRDFCDNVLDTTIAAFAGGFVGSCVPGGASPAANAVGVSNAALAREFVAAVAAAGAAGGVGSAVSCATRNIIAGENLFDNLDQAFLSGLQAGAIAGTSSGAIITAHRIQQRALHNQMFAARRAEVEAGGVAGAFETLLWCEANGRTVVVLDEADGGVHVYGPAAAHSSEPPIVLSYSAGTEYGGSQGHYARVNMDGSPVPTPITGAYSCLADALGVTPRDLAAAIQLNNGRAAFHGMTDAQVHANYGLHIGGSNLHVFETRMIGNANARVREIAEQLTGPERTRAQKNVLRVTLAQELLNDRSPDAAANQALGRMYNDAIAPRSYSIEFSHKGINNQYAEDRTGTGFPYAGHDVEQVAADHAASSSDFRLGVFLDLQRPNTLVSSNNRGLAFHALRNENVENVSYVGTGASNYATWVKNGGRPITEATLEQSGKCVDASNVRWGRRPNPDVALHLFNGDGAVLGANDLAVCADDEGHVGAPRDFLDRFRRKAMDPVLLVLDEEQDRDRAVIGVLDAPRLLGAHEHDGLTPAPVHEGYLDVLVVLAVDVRRVDRPHWLRYVAEE